VAPQIGDSQAEPLDSVGQHVLGDRQPPIRRDNDAIDAEQAVRDTWREIVQGAKPRQQLAQQPHRGTRIRLGALVLGGPEHVRQTLAGHELGDDRELRPRIVEGRHASDACEDGMLECLELIDPRAQCGFEPRCGRELRGQTQELEGGSGVVVEEEAVAETIREAFDVPRNDTLITGSANGGWALAGRGHAASGHGRCHARTLLISTS
jgi:hypothetical protein